MRTQEIELGKFCGCFIYSIRGSPAKGSSFNSPLQMETSKSETSSSRVTESPAIAHTKEREISKTGEFRSGASTSHIVTSGPTLGSVLMKLFLHSLAMFSLPIATFCYIKNHVERELGMEAPKSYIYGAVGAVIVVQFIIGSYVYQAFKEDKMERQIKKKIS